MAYIRRWVGAVSFALAVSVLLSACGSQEVRLDTQIKAPAFATQPNPTDTLSVAFQQQDSSNISELSDSPDLQESADQRTSRLVKYVASRFKKPEFLIMKIVATAKKYSKPNFPTTEDILAIIAVESTFNTDAHHRGSWGLMQIEAKSHRSKLAGGQITNIDTNIRVGTEILTEYYSITHSRSSAIMAYNVGIGSYLKGRKNFTYLRKVNAEKEHLIRV